MKDLTFSEQP